MDRDYADNVAAPNAPRFEHALFVKSRVMSRGASHAQGDRGGAFEERDRPGRLATAIEVHRDGRAHFVEPLGEHRLHGGDNATMHQRCAGRAEAAIGDFANAVVAEVPASIGLTADDLPAPEFIDGTYQRCLVQIDRPG